MHNENRCTEDSRPFSSQSGLSLIEVMVAVALFGALMLVLATVTKNFMMNSHKIERRVTLEEISRMAIENLDCEETFNRSGITQASPATCSSTSDSQAGAIFLTPMRTNMFGKREIFQGKMAADGSFSFGDYKVRVTCSSSEASLIIQAIRKNSKDWANDSTFLAGPRATTTLSGIKVNKNLCFNTDGKGRKAIANVNGGGFSVVSGAASAFRSGGGGVTCNSSDGWFLLNCHGRAISIKKVENGCAPVGAATMTCLKAD